MKKNYMRPESTVMKIEMASMIAASDPKVTVSTNPEETVEAGSVDSRDFDDWDE